MALRDVVDQLHDDDRLANARTAKKSDLAPFHERGDEIDDLDARLKDLSVRLETGERGRRAVDRPARRIRRDRGPIVNGLTQYVENSPERGLAYWHGDRTTSVNHIHPTLHAVGGRHRHSAHLIATNVLLYFGYDLDGRTAPLLGRRSVDAQCVEQLWQMLGFELHVEHGPDHLHDLAYGLVCHSRCQSYV